MNSVAIVGAGITGLTAAFRLRELQIPVTLYESSARVGGVIRTIEEDGFLAECGPNTILETSPSITRLVSDLGLEPGRVYSSAAAKNRYILRGGIPMAVPGSLAQFFKSQLFSWPAKVRIPAEVFVRRAPEDESFQESVAAFVTRRLGEEFLDYAIDPMIAGIYAGDPARLSLRHAFPGLHDLERRYGSLFLGQFLGARERRRRQTTSKQSAPKFSFAHGLQTLTNALRERLRDTLQLHSPVRTIRRTGEGCWEVSSGVSPCIATRRHAALLLCAPAHKLADIALEGGSPFACGNPLATLRQLPYAPVSSLALGFRREDVAHPLDGFGVLIPKTERRNLLGVIFSSSLFGNRAPQGHVLLTCYLGGMRAPWLAASRTGAAVEAALQDLRLALGVSGDPVFVKHTYFEKAIPQYECEFGRLKESMNQMEVDYPGLYFAGHFRDGISLGDSIIAGDAVASSLRAFLVSGKKNGTLKPLHA